MSFLPLDQAKERELIPYRLFGLLAILTTASLAVFGVPLEETHIVKEVVINMDGKTQISAIRAIIDIKEGSTFPSEEKLLQAAERERQDLVNYRALQSVAMRLEKIKEEDGVVEWRLIYDIEDAWTIFPLIYPKYDSNTGFRLGFKTFYHNAFGTMTNLYLGLGMNIGPNKTTGQWEVGEWNINPKWERIRIGPLRFFVSYLQEYEEEQFDSGVPETEFHYGYYHSAISLGSSIPISRTELEYSFGVSFNMKYGYKNHLTTSNYSEEPFRFGWTHALSFGHIDWKENFRNGQNASLGHSISPVLNPLTENYYVINKLTLSGSFHRNFGKIFYYYAQAGVSIAFNSQTSGFASVLRGVADNAMSGDWGAYINNSIGIQFWRLKGVWDAQVHPFFDIGLTAPFGGADLGRDLRYSAGLDFVLYLDAIPNLLIRGMIGVDLSRYNWDDLNKYEFTITSSLHY